MEALVSPAVWRRSLALGLTAGVLQVVVNQGDAWVGHRVDGIVVIKTIVSPLIGFGVALFSAAATYVGDRMRSESDEGTD